jgi:dTDP-4-dehydrorhamnose reductase
MKVMVIGAGGLIGSAVIKEGLHRRLTLEAVTRTGAVEADGISWQTELDLSDTDALTRLILDRWPDVVVNLAGSPATAPAAKVVLVDAAERLAQLSFHIGARLIHLSSDEVFPGRGGPYRSTDNTAGLTPLGRLKAEAEHKVLKAHPDNCLILRVPPVLGNSPCGTRSWHEQLLTLAVAGKPIEVPAQSLRQPVALTNLAELLVELSERTDLRGLFHWGGNEVCNLGDLARDILERFGFTADQINELIQPVEDESRWPRDLRFTLAPLQGKTKTLPESLEFALKRLEPPRPLLAHFRPDLFGL